LLEACYRYAPCSYISKGFFFARIVFRRLLEGSLGVLTCQGCDPIHIFIIPAPSCLNIGPRAPFKLLGRHFRGGLLIGPTVNISYATGWFIRTSSVACQKRLARYQASDLSERSSYHRLGKSLTYVERGKADWPEHSASLLFLSTATRFQIQSVVKSLGRLVNAQFLPPLQIYILYRKTYINQNLYILLAS